MPRSENSFEFQSLWESMRTDTNLVPHRSSLDPIVLKHFLPNVSIVEMDFENETMPVRLVGTEIRDFYGFDLNGIDYAKLERTPDRKLAWDIRRSYHDLPRGLYAEVDVNFPGHTPFHVAVTILPLIGKEGEKLLFSYQEHDNMRLRRSIPHKAPQAELPKHMEFIDIGAGVPVLPIETMDTLLGNDNPT